MRAHWNSIWFWAVAVLLLLALNNTAEAQKKKKKNKNSRLSFDRWCNTTTNACESYVYFYPPQDQTAGSKCLWTRLEMDHRRFTRWTMKPDSVTLRSPGNTSCTIDDVYISGGDVMELQAPTLDCYRSYGCGCDSLKPEANKNIQWTPVKQMLTKGLQRTTCRQSRTYIYVKFNCVLPQGDGDYTGYEYDEYGDLEAPATIRITWTREENSTSNKPTSNNLKDYCRSTVDKSFAGLNRWFLIIMCGISFLIIVLVLLYSIVRIVIGAVMRAARKGQGEGEVVLGTGPKKPSFLGELLNVDNYNGRSRAFTAVLMASAGLYIAGIIFEPAITPQNAYETAVSPSLRGAMNDIVGAVQISSYTGFLKQLARLLLTITLCSIWGASVFGALLYNLSSKLHQDDYADEATAKHAKKLLYAKLGISVCCLLFLDLGIILYAMGSFSLNGRWQQPVAYWFLLQANLCLLFVAHVLFVVIIIRKPQPLHSPRINDEAAKQVLSGILEPTKPSKASPHLLTDTAADTDTPNGPSTSPKQPPPGAAPAPPKIPLKQRVGLLMNWLKTQFKEEERTFHYSPWFIAPMLITLILVIFFFIRELYMIHEVHQCLGLKTCPRWSRFNSAIIPVLTSGYHAILTARTPSEFIKLLSQSLIDTPARDILAGLQSSFDLDTIKERTIADNLASFNFPTAVVTMDANYISYYNTTAPYTATVWLNATNSAKTANLTATPANVYGYKLSLRNKQMYVNNKTWEEFYFTTYTFQQDLAKLYSCNMTTLSQYLNDTAADAYASYVDPGLIDVTANIMGITSIDFTRQLMAAATKPLVVEFCGANAVVPGTTGGNDQLADIIDRVVTATSDTVYNFTDQPFNTSNVVFAQRAKLAKRTGEARRFYRQLRTSFGIGAYIGACVAVVVALGSMAVIMAVYKRAVLRLRKQVAVTRVLDRNPDIQEVLLGQRDALARAMGEGPDGRPAGEHLFAMMELMSHKRMPLCIFFYGIVFSTVLLQLIIVSILFGAAITALAHPMFWTHAFPWLASFLAALILSQLIVLVVISGTIGARIAPGDKIVNMSAWLAYFIIFSFAYIILGILLAVVRLGLIFLSAIIMSCRIDICLNALHHALDPAYNAFCCMMKMQVEMKNFADGDQDFNWGAPSAKSLKVVDDATADGARQAGELAGVVVDGTAGHVNGK